MFIDEYAKRKQCRWYDEDRIPDLSIIQDALQQTYDAVASKQNLMPYKVYVIANRPDINKQLYSWSKGGTGTVTANTNLLSAPYQFIYTARLVTDISDKVRADIDESNHLQPPCDPNLYKSRGNTPATCIEIGMHVTLLSKLLLRQGLDVAYTRCLDFSKVEDDLDFIEDAPYFAMSAGYAASDRYELSGETKPPIGNVHQIIE